MADRLLEILFHLRIGEELPELMLVGMGTVFVFLTLLVSFAPSATFHAFG